MAKGFCCRCEIKFTVENTGRQIFKDGYGYCKECHAIRQVTWRKNNPESVKSTNTRNYAENAKTRRNYRNNYYVNNKEKVLISSRVNARKLEGRHSKVKKTLRDEHVDQTDPLYSIRFYAELIRDNICHYCKGSLNPTSHALDCMNNEEPHACYNVVPCCWPCNALKSNRFSYEEMMLLVPTLRSIYRARNNV